MTRFRKAPFLGPLPYRQEKLLKNGMTDCDSCSLQKVCEEVEGMKELHFSMHP